MVVCWVPLSLCRQNEIFLRQLMISVFTQKRWIMATLAFIVFSSYVSHSIQFNIWPSVATCLHGHSPTWLLVYTVTEGSAVWAWGVYGREHNSYRGKAGRVHTARDSYKKIIIFVSFVKTADTFSFGLSYGDNEVAGGVLETIEGPINLTEPYEFYFRRESKFFVRKK